MKEHIELYAHLLAIASGESTLSPEAISIIKKSDTWHMLFKHMEKPSESEHFVPEKTK